MSKNKILCIIDAQKDFVDGALGTNEAVEAVPHICELIDKWSGVVFTTQDTHDSEKYLSTMEGRKLPTKHCIKGTEGWKIYPKIADALKYSIAYPSIEKSTFGDFGIIDAVKKHCKLFSVNYEELDITIVGFCTDICVLSNAILLKTAFPEANITVESKCCSGTSVPAHKAALVAMKSCQINIVL